MNEKVSNVLEILQRLKEAMPNEQSKLLKLDKCTKIIEKINTISSDCEECQNHLIEFENQLRQLEENGVNLDQVDMAAHKKWMTKMISHLHNKHNVVSEGYYFSLFMSIGISLGVAFGLTVFDNIALGIPIGMSMGMAIGAGMDADAKKKGRTL